jgi:hypothetical protein
VLTVGFQALVGTIAFAHANSIKVQTLGVCLHDISFKVWMRYLGGIVALLGLALQAKTMMIASDAGCSRRLGQGLSS